VSKQDPDGFIVVYNKNSQTVLSLSQPQAASFRNPRVKKLPERLLFRTQYGNRAFAPLRCS
jgi:hypothetical protein